MEKNLNDLIKDISNEKQTVLFLGAGVNYDKEKRLLWNDILSEFIKNALPLLNMPPDDIKELKQTMLPDKNSENSNDDDLSEFTTESKVTVVKKLLGNDYVPFLRNIIYSQCNKKVLSEAVKSYLQGKDINDTPFYTLFAIAELIIKHDNIKAVVTYNYDNFLTEAIRLLQQHPEHFSGDCKRRDKKLFCPVDVYSGWTDGHYVNSSFLIYHPHGYIQPPGDLIPNKRNKVVMTMEEFYDNAKEVFSWQTATQIHFLTHYMCVYLGASLTDMNMQRLLNYADIEHNNEEIYYIMRKGNAQTRLKAISLSENHLKVVAVDNYGYLYKELLNDKNYGK